MTPRSWRLGVFAPAVLALGACSSSTEAPGPSDGGIADAATYSDTRATVPIVELNETGPSAPTGPVTCGAKTCIAPPGGMIPLLACCLSDSTCGATFDLSQFGGAIPGAGGDGGIPCLDTAPGTADPSCPSQSMAGFMMAGCCSRAGVCGVDLSMVSMGAIGCNGQLPFAGLGMGGQAMDAQPQSCGSTARDASDDVTDATAMAPDARSSQQDASAPMTDAMRE